MTICPIVDAMVSRINSKVQGIGGEGPIHYLTREVPVEELVALYCVADVLITTPIRYRILLWLPVQF